MLQLALCSEINILTVVFQEPGVSEEFPALLSLAVIKFVTPLNIVGCSSQSPQEQAQYFATCLYFVH